MKSRSITVEEKICLPMINDVSHRLSSILGRSFWKDLYLYRNHFNADCRLKFIFRILDQRLFYGIVLRNY